MAARAACPAARRHDAARIVARERDAATIASGATSPTRPPAARARLLTRLLDVPDGSRDSQLDRMRKAETTPSGPGPGPRNGASLLERASEVAELLGGVDLSVIPETAGRGARSLRIGCEGDGAAPSSRASATRDVVATVKSLEARTVDDALELFDGLMTNDLLARAAWQSRKEKLLRYPRLSQDAGKRAAAGRGAPRRARPGGAVAARADLRGDRDQGLARGTARSRYAPDGGRAATGLTPIPAGNGALPRWTAPRRCGPFVPMLCETIEFAQPRVSSPRCATSPASAMPPPTRAVPAGLDTSMPLRGCCRVPFGARSTVASVQPTTLLWLRVRGRRERLGVWIHPT